MNCKDYRRHFNALLKAVVIFAAALIICSLIGCKRVEYVTLPEYHTDTLRTIQLQKDSVYLRDSVYVTRELRGDTLYLTTDRWRTEFRDRLKVDTAYVSKTDSVVVVKEVEKPLTKWQRLKMNVGGGAMVAALVMLGLLVWRIVKK